MELGLNHRETELCLGLPGGGGGGGGGGETESMKITGKRGFSETVDLKLNFNESSDESCMDLKKEKMKSNASSKLQDDDIKDSVKPPAANFPSKYVLSSVLPEFPLCSGGSTRLLKGCFILGTTRLFSAAQFRGRAAKRLKESDLVRDSADIHFFRAQVVGWPPVRSFRKNIMAQKSNADEADKAAGSSGSAFVKVSMDGAPYLRKVDLKMYKSYKQLSDALAKMFSSFTMSNYGAQGMIDFMNESKLMDLLNSSEYVPSYEDKDGDWMLVGDVPWEMFVESCKRLRIMKGSEAIGLAPRAMEKCKNRS